MKKHHLMQLFLAPHLVMFHAVCSMVMLKLTEDASIEDGQRLPIPRRVAVPV
uniref:Uncharacterized protein n=1 Tax=Tetraselmis sp. GSL018 TaxID=582737 RepID=A0A061R149_9CHLO